MIKPMKLLFKSNLLILFFLLSCSTFPKFRASDPRFNPYREKFEYIYNENINHININLDILKIGTVASCYTLGRRREILVNSMYWDRITEYQREIVIFHELGHCVLNRGHRTDYKIFSGYYCPASIMNYFVFTNWEVNRCYLINYDYYIHELKHGKEFDDSD